MWRECRWSQAENATWRKGRRLTGRKREKWQKNQKMRSGAFFWQKNHFVRSDNDTKSDFLAIFVRKSPKKGQKDSPENTFFANENREERKK